LVSVDDYGWITNDRANDPDDVARALDEAVTMVEVECVRTLGYGQYTENLYLYADGKVYPSAVPIDPTKPISSGEALYNPATDNAPGSIIQGFGVWVGWFTPLPWMPVWQGVIPPQTNVTYMGGYHPYGVKDGTTPGLPPKLARVIARIAYYSQHPAVVQAMGQKSISIGGVSISGDLSSFMLADPQLKRDILRFRRAQAHAWET
jgi:hypothetical protein